MEDTAWGKHAVENTIHQARNVCGHYYDKVIGHLDNATSNLT